MKRLRRGGWQVAAIGALAGLASRRSLRAWRGMKARRYPNFVYEDVPADLLGVPVFTYHSLADPNTPDSVTPEDFGRDLAYLARNGYVTLSAAELAAHLTLGEPVPERAVLLAFDDGRATLWTVAHPLLQRFGCKAVCFLVPGVMTDDPARPTFQDRDQAQAAGLLDADLGHTPAVTWAEVGLMHAAGTIDFQSHTLEHALIHYGPRIVDFVNPAYRAGYHRYGVPVVRERGADRVDRCLEPGTPVYLHKPRMEAARRFYDDEALRAACVAFTREQGGSAFFQRDDWRARLLAFAAQYRQDHALAEGYETPQEQAQAIFRSLAESKRQIEAHLPGHVVSALCYPWHRYSMQAAALAQEVGYTATFIDVNPQKPWPRWNDPYSVQRRLPVNVYGDDPHQITRIDARGGMVRSLPGEGRITYRQRVAQTLLGQDS